MSLDGCFAGRKLSSFSRYFHVNIHYAAANKQILSQLRKTTGFPIVNCRKALELSNNDLKQVRNINIYWYLKLILSQNLSVIVE